MAFTQLWVFWVKDLAVLVEPLGDVSQIGSFLVFLGSGLILIGGKVNYDH